MLWMDTNPQVADPPANVGSSAEEEDDDDVDGDDDYPIQRINDSRRAQSNRPNVVLPNQIDFHPSLNGRNGWRFENIYEVGEEVRVFRARLLVGLVSVGRLATLRIVSIYFISIARTRSLRCRLHWSAQILQPSQRQ
jgi:hypothetical protein